MIYQDNEEKLMEISQCKLEKKKTKKIKNKTNYIITKKKIKKSIMEKKISCGLQ